MKNIEDYLHLYLGCECLLLGDPESPEPNIKILRSIPFLFGELHAEFGDNTAYPFSEIKPLLRKLSDMTEEEILQCGKFICALPNEKDCTHEVSRNHNTVGAKFFSPAYTCGQYFSIWNEKNKPGGIGHIEVGWYNDDKIDRRKTKDLWKIGGCHELTIYLLSKHFDLFGLIPEGLAIDKTTLK